MANTTYATLSDLQQRMYRELTQEEEDLALVLLQDASTHLTMEYERCKKAVPTSLTGKNALKMVVCNMVKRILQRPDASDVYGQDLKSLRTDVGPFSETYEFSNPDGSLYLRSAERKLLGLYKGSSIAPIRLGIDKEQ